MIFLEKGQIEPKHPVVNKSVIPWTVFYYVLKCGNIFLTMVLVGLLVQYYRYKTMVKKLKWYFPNLQSAFINTTTRFKFAAELIVILIVPLPFGRVIGLGDWVGLFMFLRLYIVARLIREHSAVYQNRFEIMKANSHFRKIMPQFGWTFASRVLFYQYTIATVVVSSLTLVLIFAFCIYVAEK
eukprot:GEZU01022890.1.p1 GENE.GEZU01022890.1~~GEZU01022890.1.p1  ORF type:complete len:183 (-),score=27.27 GEZU01022890.1:359-907(-)